MNETNWQNTVLALVPVFFAGTALGFFYFRALWGTVKRIGSTERPLRLILGSFVVRLAVVLTGFFLIMDGHWERLVVLLAGFLLMRGVLIRRFGRITS